MNHFVKTTPSLLVEGNCIIAPDGSPLILRGVMPPDPAALDEAGEFTRVYYASIAERGANVIRVAVHPERWVKDSAYSARYLEPIIAWAQELDLYVIIDWHYIGNVATGAGSQMPKISHHALDLTLEFWKQTANRFKDVPNVLFEIFNEPESISAQLWRSSAQKIVDTIRASGAKQIIVVGGIDFGKDLSWVLAGALEDDNLVYASHIYPEHKRDQWPIWFGKVSQRYPVLITEWGFMQSDERASNRHLVGNTHTYAEPLLAYLEERGIGWVACWYDEVWLPPMFHADGGATAFGDFVFARLRSMD